VECEGLRTTAFACVAWFDEIDGGSLWLGFRLLDVERDLTGERVVDDATTLGMSPLSNSTETAVAAATMDCMGDMGVAVAVAVIADDWGPGLSADVGRGRIETEGVFLRVRERAWVDGS
jgi:hypothetical protein